MSTHPTEQSWRADLAWYLGLTAAVGIAFGVGQGLLAGLLAAGGMLAFTAVLAVGRRRFDTLRVAGGAGDERNQRLYEQALAVSGGILGLLVTAWFLVGVARGEPDLVLLTLTVVFAATFVLGAAIASRRG